MLYLATYPRSGNSLLQGILRKNFGFQPLDGAGSAARNLARTIGDPERLETRRGLARAVDDRTYLKTHAWPFPPFLEGERVIQFVRNPGATLWSYFRLLMDNLPSPAEHRFRGRPPTLEAVIAGEVGIGSWSAYHEVWSAAAAALPDRYLAFNYEDVVADQALTRARLAEFLSKPPRSEAPIRFDSYRQRKNSWDWDVRGTSSGYEQFFSRRQLELLWDAHGATAEKFGYSPPDLDLAAPDEQVRRLGQALDLAWTHAARAELHPWGMLKRRLRRKFHQARIVFRRAPP